MTSTNQAKSARLLHQHTPTMTSIARGVLVSLLLPYSYSFTLTPQTSPESIVRSQLEDLKVDDMYQVFKFASPSNKEITGPWQNFGEMVRSPPYHHLVNHKRAELLLTVQSSPNKSWQGLVRVLSSSPSATSSNVVVEYWWSLSRCKTGPFPGCYMVDAVIPAG
jgi:hypothetical protein